MIICDYKPSAIEQYGTKIGYQGKGPLPMMVHSMVLVAVLDDGLNRGAKDVSHTRDLHDIAEKVRKAAFRAATFYTIPKDKLPLCKGGQEESKVGLATVH